MKLFLFLNIILTQSFLFKKNVFEKHFSTTLFNNRRDYSPYRNKYYEQMIKKLNRNQTERDLTMIMINNNIFEENLNRTIQIAKLFEIKIQLSNETENLPYGDDDGDIPRSYGYGPQGRNNGNKQDDDFTIIKNSEFCFNDIGGYNLVKEELSQCVDLLVNYEKYNKFNIRVPKGLIFEGPPGTGKTLFAKALAGESNCSFISVSGSDFSRKYVGEGASKVRKLFSIAKKNIPCIIFIDELDSIGRRRSSDGESSSSERDNTLNSLLVELDGFSKSNGIFVVSATNRIDIIDPALLRAGRIDKQIRLDLPDNEARKKIIEIYIKGKPHDNTILIDDLTEMLQGFTGAQIENVLNEAMLFALRNNREIFNIDDINFIYDKTFAGWTPIPHKFDENMLERIAVHEMGHAIVGYLSQYHSKLNKVVINLSSPNSPGYTLFRPDTNSVQLKEALFEHLMILLAGRIAEEEIFGVSITTGASNDLFEVHKLAVKMIENYGMGTHTIYPLNSEKYKILKDNDIINLIEYAEQISRELIISCRDLILYTSKLLVEKKIIKYDELENIINNNYNKVDLIKKSENKLRSYNKITKLDHMMNKKFYLDE